MNEEEISSPPKEDELQGELRRAVSWIRSQTPPVYSRASVRPGQSPLWIRLFYLASTLAAMLLAMIAWQWKRGDSPGWSSVDSAFASSDRTKSKIPGGITCSAKSPRIARIANMLDCQWTSGKPCPQPFSVLAVGQRLWLNSGLLEIRYDSGDTVLLEGPAIFEVRANGGCIESGRLVARRGQESPMVAAGDAGATAGGVAAAFVIRTPILGVVVGVATEVGVWIEGNEAVLAQVFEGDVALQPVSNDGGLAYPTACEGERVRVEQRDGRLEVASNPGDAESDGGFVRQIHGSRGRGRDSVPCLQ